MPSITYVPEADDGAVASWIAGQLTAALAASRGDVAICLPGGSTPFPILRQLAGRVLDWTRIAVWPGDDRIVPEDSPASNTGRIRALLEPLGARIVPLTEGAEPPRFALCWLGMGEDGHVASLFPNADPQIDAHRAVIRLTPDPLPPEAPFDRLTLPLPALLNSDAMMFVIRGAAKRALFEQAARGRNDLPAARLLRAADRPVTCFT
jgi:6-phosphogluconolactonase